MREINQSMDWIPVIKNHVPSWLKSMLSAVVILSVLVVISRIVSDNISSLASTYPAYDANVIKLVDTINSTFDIDLRESVIGYSADLDIGKILGSTFNSITEILGSAVMIIIYALFIFLEASRLPTKVRKAIIKQEQYDELLDISQRIENSIGKYLRLKTLISLLTGSLSYVVLLLIGLDAPVFWAFLIFLLNYIPTIGSLVATTFPATYCLLQFGEFTPALITLGVISAIQLMIGNILEPRIMGNTMNISPLMTIIALSFWGAIWGVTGMFLSIPITVIIIIILAEFEKTRPIAVMLSEKGNVEVPSV